MQPTLSQRARWAGGQPIGDLMQRALSQPQLISLAAGFVDQHSLPVEAMQEAFQAVWQESSVAMAALQYGTTSGHMPLRRLLLERQCHSDGLAAPPAGYAAENVLIAAGSNQLLHLIGDTLLDPGDIVLCAAPTYFVYLGILRNLGVRAIGVATDSDGIRPDAVEETLRQLDAAGELSRVKMLYVCSYFDNPAGATLAAARRGPLVELVRRWSKSQRIYLLEDAAYRALRFAGDDLPSLWSHDRAGDTVILTQTFSKSFAPGIRVGYAIVPPELHGPLCDQKNNLDFGSANVNQYLVHAMLERGLDRPHVERLQATYRAKASAMVEAAEQFLAPLPGVRFNRPSGGLYVWVELSPDVETGLSSRLFEAALGAGVLYVPGEYCFPSEGLGLRRNGMRLSYGVQPPQRIVEGVRLLAQAAKEVIGG